MSVYALLNGQYIGVEPRTTGVYANRPTGGAWEALAVTSHSTWVDVRFVAANLQLCITPDGKLETRPAGAIGEWEQLALTVVAGRASISRAGVTLALEGYQVVPALEPLLISGLDFMTAGTRCVLNGTDQFCAYRRYFDSGAAALAPLIAESHELGFDLWRVFMQGSARQNHILELNPREPGYYDFVRPFADTVNAAGIRLLATVFVDNQDIGMNMDHWRRMADLLRGSATLLSGGNEAAKNGWNPGDLTDPGMLWSRGSGTADEKPFTPTGSFAEFHPVRSMPTMMRDAVASPLTIDLDYQIHIPLVIDEPIGFAEVDKDNSRSADPRIAYRLARHYATECAGAVFHNDSGMRCQVMSPRVRECADAWQRGMRL